jgi:Calpain family cysteine protease
VLELEVYWYLFDLKYPESLEYKSNIEDAVAMELDSRSNQLTKEMEDGVIVLLEDSDEESVEVPSDSYLALSSDQQTAVDLFRSILPQCTHPLAVQRLAATDWNVERALSSALDGHKPNTTTLSDSASFHHPTISAQDVPQFGSRIDAALDKPDCQTLAAGATSLNAPAAKRQLCFDDASKISPHVESDAANDSLSSTDRFARVWYECMDRAKSLDHFVDPDFGPTMQSLDGRQRDSGPTAAHVVLCKCGVKAAAKQVQSDGPNYGRFYLSCGQVQRRRARVVPVRQRRATNQDNDLGNDGAPADEIATEKEAQDNAKPTSTAVVYNPYSKKRRVPTTPVKEKPESPSPTASPSSPPTPQRRHCNFFQWDSTGSLGATNMNSPSSGGYGSIRGGRRFSWFRFGLEQHCTLYQTAMATSHVRQGAVGNCWFLSALAVVAEKPYLVRTVVPHTALNTAGCYQINLYLDGTWQPIIVDSYLPIVLVPVDGSSSRKALSSRDGALRRRDGIPVQISNGSSQPANAGGVGHDASSSTTYLALPAFCAAPHRQLWSCLVEKAYAKAHGSYQQLSGGFIAEGLQDLTGAPTETVVFQAGFLDVDTFWARLLSFAAAGFLMGVATAQGGDGLVGGHAYSVLDVLEVPDSIAGEQCKVTDYYGSSKRRTDLPDTSDASTVEDTASGGGMSSSKMERVERGARTTIRLVRIRNPWGVQEWKGDWSADSERWTRALRKRLGSDTFAKGDGTFYMSYEDMLQRFHHMDVAKTQMVRQNNSISFLCSALLNSFVLIRTCLLCATGVDTFLV